MARKSQVSTVRKNGEDLPDGFKPVNPDRAGLFFVIEEGATLQGVLLGAYPSRRHPGKAYYQIRLSQPCQHLVRKTDEKDRQGKTIYDDAAGAVGDLVNVDEKAALSALSNYADGKHEVYIKALRREDIGNGQTMWRFAVGAKPLSQADDVPF